MCVFGANEDERTHLIATALTKLKVRAVFVGRVAAYDFESLRQVSVRTSMHFPICFAEVSRGAGTAYEVQALVGSGKIVAAFSAGGSLATQFLNGLDTESRNFKLFEYDWREKDASRPPPPSDVRKLTGVVKEALTWAKRRAGALRKELDRVFPWRRYEALPRAQAISFSGTCRCEA